MRRISAFVPAVLSIFVLACSSAPDTDSTPTPTTVASAALDPSGMYDFVATMGGESRTGTLEIERSAANGFTGEAWLEGEGDPAQIVSGSIVGNHVLLNALVGMNDITFELDFTGAAFAGTITAGDQVIDVTGTKRAN